MALAVGVRVGPYEVLAPLGAGGMGEVYRARDRRLNRDVAVKVLPQAFALDPERLARFTREAQVLASLNHPNIAAIYGFEDAAGVPALVLELVEGPTLADRIARGPIPLDDALPLARQIADALEAAHEQGIVHRDLKPANVKLRPDATVKVLDFGLAKTLEPSAAGADATASPTITTPAMTRLGVILGTAAYMSPEQAKGRAADRRTDLWAFGCVLYEMLTGARAFGGDDVSDTLASVLRGEPDWRALPAGTPSSIRRLLRRCLEKDRRRRLDSAAGARLEIDEALATPVPDTPDTPGTRGWRRAALTAAAALAVGAAAAGGGVWIAMRPGPVRVTRTTIPMSGDAALVNTVNGNLAITRDGSRLVYHGSDQLLVRRLEQLESTVLVAQGAPDAPFLSPDDRWVGFFDGPVLKKVAITGGPPVTLADNTISGAGGPLGATWSAQDAIVFATSSARGLRRVSAGGGAVETLTTPDRLNGEFAHRWPAFLPDGRSLLFTTDRGNGDDTVLLDLATGTQRVLIRGASHARYLPTGHLVYGTGDTLRAVAFDLARRAVVGTPVPVVAEVGTVSGRGYEFDVAGDGTLVYRTSTVGPVGAPPTLVWVDRRGQETPLGAPASPFLHPRLAPDGAGVVFLIANNTDRARRGLWSWDIERARLVRVLDETGGTVPLWTPDGRHLVFSMVSASMSQSDRPNLFMRAADGTGSTTRLTESQNSQHPTGVTPDSRQVVFYEATPAQQRDIKLLTLTPAAALKDAGEARPQVTPLVETRFDEGGGVVSPNGRWLAYEANNTGAYEIWVRPFPAVADGVWQVSTAGGAQPLWARSGRELFYVAPDGALMAVAVEPRGSVWSAGAPVRLVAGPYLRGASDAISTRQYDVSADGQRFLMIKRDPRDSAATALLLVQNWFQELNRLVPTR